MGGGYYDRDVYTSSSNRSYSQTAQKVMSQSVPTYEMLPANFGRIVCTHENPILVEIDHTGSMGDSAKDIFDKCPMFWGQLKKHNYLPDPSVSFFAVGDVRSDKFPLQMCPFAEGITLDTQLKKLFLEGNGGGQGSESYELGVYPYAYNCDLPNAKLAFAFIIGDEDYCDYATADAIKEYCDPSYKGKNIPAKEVFEELKKKFNVFRLHRTYDCGYADEDAQIVRRWKKVLGNERVYHLKDPKAVVDMMLGIIAILSETRTLDDYVVDMKARNQTTQRIDLITENLTKLDKNSLVVMNNLPATTPTTTRKTGSRRI
jgi:hypothetical protein